MNLLLFLGCLGDILPKCLFAVVAVRSFFLEVNSGVPEIITCISTAGPLNTGSYSRHYITCNKIKRAENAVPCIAGRNLLFQNHTGFPDRKSVV